LDEELGVEPGMRLRWLEQAILRHDASLEAAPPGSEPGLTRGSSRVEPAAAAATAPPIALAAREWVPST
jgi:hypothetical protein